MRFLTDGPDDAFATVLLAHGAGAPMDSPAMNAMAGALAAAGMGVARFEFAYMAARRDGARKPPPRAKLLMDEYRGAAASVRRSGPLIVGGKSMGGRVASMIADELYAGGAVAGLLCLGYPFHPPSQPLRTRTAHLSALRTPTLICQGTRDPFGTREEVAAYGLSGRIEICWLEDGDHDLKPRKSISGHSAADHLVTTARMAAAWARRIIG